MRTTLVVAACVIAVSATVACGDAESALPQPMSVTLPSVASRSRSEILAALCSGQRPPALDVSASAFELGSANPRPGDPQWTAMIDQMTALRRELSANSSSSSCCLTPIRVEVTGYTDSSGNLSVNQALSLARANATKVALTGAGFDPSTIDAIGGGVGGKAATDRRVTVQVVADRQPPGGCGIGSAGGG